MGVRLRDVPAAAGGLWIRQGFAAFRRRPGVFLMAFAGMTALLFLLTLLGLLGLVLFGLALPLSSLLFMMLTAGTLVELPGHRQLALTPLAATPQRRRGLAGLAALYCTGVLLMSVLASWVAGDSMQAYVDAVRAYYGSTAADAAMPEPSGRLMGSLMVLYGGLSLLSMAMWHAPALVHWAGQGAAQSLFSSLFALWRTWRAFLVYVVGWTTIAMGVTVVANLLALVGLGVLVLPLFFSAMMTVGTVFYVSLYFTFTGTFELDA